jgi:hypothetical protein
VKTERTRKYHLHAAGPNATTKVEDEGLTLDLDDLLLRLQMCQTEDLLVKRVLGGYPGYMAIEYEELFPRIGAPPSEQVLGRVAAWLGIEADFPKSQPRYRKQSVLPLSEAITNYDEIARALRATEFEYVLEDEAPYLAQDEVNEVESLQAGNL